jgi:hypothetical protein
MATQDNITRISATEGPTEADQRWDNAERFAAQYRMPQLVALLYACASEDVACSISAAEKVNLAFLAHELAQEVEIAIDLVPPTSTQKGGVQ